MNIQTVLKPDFELKPGEVPASEDLVPPYHLIKVGGLGSMVIVEDANFALENEKGEALRSLATFRVLLGAELDGVRLHVWKQGADLMGAPSISLKIAGWDHGQITEVTRQNHYQDDPGRDHDGSVRGIPERILHIGNVDTENRGDEGEEAERRTAFGRWLDDIRQEYRRVRGHVR